MMRFSVDEALSEPHSDNNEDLFGVTDQAAWALDGATGVGTARVVPGPSDATWLVAHIDAALRDEVKLGGDSEDLLRRTIRRVIERFQKEALRLDAPDGEKPSTCLALARILENDRLELSNLGDCKIVHRVSRGTISVYGSSALEALDGAVEAEIVLLQHQGLSLVDIWPRILPIIIGNRSRMNRPDGYWILDLGERSIPYLQRFELATQVGDEVLLLTDGFHRLVEVYKTHSYSSLFDAARTDGLRPLYRLIRQIEAEDMQCRRYTRTKPRDDATAIRLTVAR